MQLSSGPARPVVLFPVRLETRFFPLADGSSELRVRVYPDKVHIDSHEPELTADELTWGRHFWEQTWRAANDEERGKTAWRQIGRPFRSAARRVDRPRAQAAESRKTVRQRSCRRRSADAETAALSVSRDEELRRGRARQATRVLPNQWIVLGYKNGRLVVNVKGRFDSGPAGDRPRPYSARRPNCPINLGIDRA